MDRKPTPIDVFEDARPALTGLAYRMLGSYADAEDVVQDTCLSWMGTDATTIDQPAAWLNTVCTRKALDALKSARRQRERYAGPWLPEPVHTRALDTPETGAALTESLTAAFLLVLERLGPKERAAFLLHDVFGAGYQQIADSLSVSEASCRKLVSRARSNVRRETHAHAAPRRCQDDLVEAFRVAIATGSADELARLLSDDATLSADSGGKVVAIRRPLEGAGAILKFVTSVLSPAWSDGELTTAELNSGRALVVREAGKTVAVVSFAFDADSKASNIFIVRNPDKLAHDDAPALR